MRFDFPGHDRFRNRVADLRRLNEWWEGEETNALAIYGRRRVGKSWLIREFAHGKRALMLVADRRSLGPQLEDFASQLESLAGIRPALRDLAGLIEVLYGLAVDRRMLVAIDEFQYLLPERNREQAEVLSSIQRAMEGRDRSQLKLILSGSYIGQMEGLLSGPLRGRLTPLRLDPLSFGDALSFFEGDIDPAAAVERYALTGGMSMYLDLLGQASSLRRGICEQVLAPRSPLFSDPREVLDEELRMPGVYYSLIDRLAHGSSGVGDLAAALGRKSTDLQSYLDQLVGMRLLRKLSPLGTPGRGGRYRYELADDFMRFWFRFVFPYREELESGLEPGRLYSSEIRDQLPGHVSPTFERLSREWVIRGGAEASRVGSWWGRSTNAERKRGERTTEEVDVVGMKASTVTVVGECKWTRAKMGLETLSDLERFKLPAMAESGARFRRGGPAIVLFSRSGFSDGLRNVAKARSEIALVDMIQLVADLR